MLMNLLNFLKMILFLLSLIFLLALENNLLEGFYVS